MIETLGYAMPDDRPLDGVSLLSLLRGEMETRPTPIPYRFLERREAMFGSPTLAMIDNRYKFLTNLSADGAEELCFDLLEDPGETRNIAPEQRGFCGEMRDRLEAVMASCRKSHFGGDYAEPYEPVNEFQEVTGDWM